MKPFFVLLGTFIISLLILGFATDNWNFKLAGNIAMSVMLVFTSIGHFAYSKGMEMMLPEFMPFKKMMVLITGLIEIIEAIGLLIPSLQRIAVISLIIFFILILPANIYGALKKVNYQEGTHSGPGVPYLWFRVPLQVFFILWVYLSN